MLRKLSCSLIETGVFLTSVGVIVFVMLNVATGCENWDREQWTKEHSCIAPSDILEALIVTDNEEHDK